MQFVRRLLTALLFVGAAVSAQAQDFRAGRDYLVLPTPQPGRLLPGWPMTRRPTLSPTGPKTWPNWRCCWSRDPE